MDDLLDVRSYLENDGKDAHTVSLSGNDVGRSLTNGYVVNEKA